MYLTENEAKQKWCPEIRGLVESTKGNMYSITAINVVEGGLPPCIASGCMMWRWRDVNSKHRETGYCGLAGRPE